MSKSTQKAKLLRDPLLKIERAKQHINDLNGKVAEFLSHSPFQLRIRQSSNPPQRFIFFQNNRRIPDEFSLIVGDAVHNLRTALDQLCFGIVGSKAKSTNSVGFPFAKDAERLESTIATRQMNIAPKEVVNEIHALQPYPSGNKYLHAVHDFDNRDKHHAILTVGLGVEMPISFLQELVAPNSFEWNGPTDAIVAAVGEFMIHLDIEGPVESFDKIADQQPLFTVGFGEGEALSGSPVIFALTEMAKATEGAVRRIAATYFR